MEETSLLREMAEHWMLLTMFTLFIGAILWPFRPGSRKDHDEAANIPFAHDDNLAEGSDPTADTKEAQA